MKRAAGLLCVAAGAVFCAVPLHAVTPAQLERAKVRLRTKGHRQATPYSRWVRSLEAAITDIQRNVGAGGYSVKDDAHDALAAAFTRSATGDRPVFLTRAAKPSFCSGAVYTAVLSGLIRWDSAQPTRRISAEAWQALLPQRMSDGTGVWGCANANGPGFAVLVHRLRAGFSFCDWNKAAPADVMKVWWTDEIGHRERGHLVIVVRNEGDSMRVWSSNMPQDGKPGGYGFRTIAKKDVRHVLITRITDPAAFNNAPHIGTDAWLASLLSRPADWAECLRRSGIRP